MGLPYRALPLGYQAITFVCELRAASQPTAVCVGQICKIQADLFFSLLLQVISLVNS